MHIVNALLSQMFFGGLENAGNLIFVWNNAPFEMTQGN